MDKIPVHLMEGKVSRKRCGCMLERHNIYILEERFYSLRMMVKVNFL